MSRTYHARPARSRAASRSVFIGVLGPVVVGGGGAPLAALSRQRGLARRRPDAAQRARREETLAVAHGLAFLGEAAGAVHAHDARPPRPDPFDDRGGFGQADGPGHQTTTVHHPAAGPPAPPPHPHAPPHPRAPPPPTPGPPNPAGPRAHA